MNRRIFGKTKREITEIGLGTWQLGTKWGEDFNEEEAFKILDTSYKAGINFIDTADVYNNTQSERVIGEHIKTIDKTMYIVTKAGRQLKPHTAGGYTIENIENIEKYIDV